MQGLVSVRLALIGTLVLLTFLAMQVVGVVAATNYQDVESKKANAAIAAAHKEFQAEVQRVEAEGTPKALVDPIVAQEKTLQAKRRPSSSSTLMVDKTMIDALNKHLAELNRLVGQVTAAETQTEVKLHQQLLEAIKKLRDMGPPAQGAGLDPAAYIQFADQTEQANPNLSTPNATQQLIDGVNAKVAQLKAATDAQIAANEALSAAKDDATSAVAAAQRSLGQAKSIPVLKVDDAAAAIAAGADKFAHAATLADYQAVASAMWAQNATLRNLLNTRQSAFDLLATTQDHLNRAKAAGKDVANDEASLAPAAAALNAAGDLPSIEAARAQIQAVKNDVDSKYWLAIYGTGKVIVISIARQELMALENGVPVLHTLVTTGRPALPTITGTFHIMAKYSPYCMRSSWPPGSPYYWAGCAGMSYAMEFEGSGYFIHDAPWRSRYGPGTNDSNGTHGCVNVPRNASQMDFLYNWTPMGTTVVILQGDFGS
jgi:lipoprotein-anchoring transpeptidase ErfK/SrfK